MNDLEKAWGRIILASPEDVIELQGEIATSMASVHTYIEELKLIGTTLQALIKAGDARRLGRVAGMQVGHMRFDGRIIEADVRGSTGIYSPHITVFPTRGHYCTCPDWMQNGRKVGPCKHVLALGTAFRDSRLVPALNRVANALMDILEHSEV